MGLGNSGMEGVCRGPPNAVRHHGEEKAKVNDVITEVTDKPWSYGVNGSSVTPVIMFLKVGRTDKKDRRTV
jgi:hypothetical protein